MSLNVAVQMDPIERINIAGDSSFAMMLEAQARGHKLFYYTPDKLSMRDGRVTATIQHVTVQDVKGAHFELGEPVRRDLQDMDVVLLRQCCTRLDRCALRAGEAARQDHLHHSQPPGLRRLDRGAGWGRIVGMRRQRHPAILSRGWEGTVS